MNKEEYSQLFGLLTQLYDSASLPTALVDQSLQVLWANGAALAAHPSFRLPDGLRVVLPESFAQAFLQSPQGSLTGPTTFPLPITGREIHLLPTGAEGLFLLHSTLSQSEGSPLLPEGSQRLLATFSNQFRLPISGIFSTLTTLRGRLMELEDPAIGAYLRRINNYSYQMLRGYMDITAYIRQQTGAVHQEPVLFDLTAFLKNLCDALRIVTGSVGIPFTWDLPNAVLPVRCDQTLLTQALLQLVANSCRFGGEDNSIFLCLRETAGQMIITLRDTGLGIPDELQERVFEPYFSYDHNGAPVAGMGLGLTLAKYAVTLQGGTIALQSQEDVGTTVTFTLPKPAEDLPLAFSDLSSSSDYLYDRFSLMHVLLSDTVPPPMP